MTATPNILADVLHMGMLGSLLFQNLALTER